MKYFSTFSGIGGFELAMPSEGECVGFSEIDKYAIQIYNKHFNHKNYGDITRIVTAELPEFDLLVGGFPCQSFSMAGKRRGFEDTRGTLFFELARILKDKRPKYFVFENVKGLLSHNNGNTFKTIIATLDELGYDLQWQVLNSKNFGVPQNRERVFIVGHIRGTSRPEVFPIGKDANTNNETQPIPSATVTTRTGSTARGQQFLIKDRRQSNEIRIMKDNCETISSTYGMGGNNVPMVLRKSGDRGKQKTYLSETVGSLAANPMSDNVPMVLRERPYYENGVIKLKMYKYEDTMPTVSTNCGNGDQKNMIKEQSQIRRLTPVECERLQGFPDGWTDCVSDTQRYKTLGNAVTVNTVKAIMDKLLTNLN